jgi:hypothetical protein
MHKPTLFVHCGTGNDRYSTIMDEFFSSIEMSGMKNEIDVRVCSVGKPQTNETWFNQEYHNDDFTKGEFFTLEILRQFCKNVGVGVPVGYVHTKGVFNGFDNPCIIDWRQYMGYFVIERARDCIKALGEGYDAVGVDWVTLPNKHFSGNFWWASSQYINRLPQINPPIFQIEGAPTPRHLAEFWIGYGFPKVKSMHNSNICVYERHLHRYPKEKYALDKKDHND